MFPTRITCYTIGDSLTFPLDPVKFTFIHKFKLTEMLLGVKLCHKNILLNAAFTQWMEACFVVIESVPRPDNMVDILWGPAHVRSPRQLKPPFTD